MCAHNFKPVNSRHKMHYFHLQILMSPGSASDLNNPMYSSYITGKTTFFSWLLHPLMQHCASIHASMSNEAAQSVHASIIAEQTMLTNERVMLTAIIILMLLIIFQSNS